MLCKVSVMLIVKTVAGIESQNLLTACLHIPQNVNFEKYSFSISSVAFLTIRKESKSLEAPLGF